MRFLLVFTGLSSSSTLWGHDLFAAALAHNAAIEMYNPMTAFKQCSHGDKKWHICHGDFSPYWYCPSVVDFNASHVERLAPCFTCPDAGSDCETTVADVLLKNNISEEAVYGTWGLIEVVYSVNDVTPYVRVSDSMILLCQQLCEAGKTGTACSPAGDTCTVGSHFCDFASDVDFGRNISGTCKACPLDQDQCYQDGFVTSFHGKQNCADCKLFCSGEGKSNLTVNGKEIPSYPIPIAIQESYQNVSGPLIDCSNLVLESEDVCAGAEGHVCVVDYSILGESEVRKTEWKLSNAAEENGCVAIISNDLFIAHSYDELAIPFVRVDKEDSKHLLKNVHNSVAQVEVSLFGTVCNSNVNTCNLKLHCGENQFCRYHDVIIDAEYTAGYCEACPTFDNGQPDPAGCFFDRTKVAGNTFSFSSPENVKSCAEACNATIVSDGCKFCPSELSALDFGVEDKEDKCYFCPNNDVQYPDKFVPLFGKNITCWMVQTFFNRMEVHKDSPNCRLVQSMNYICGCEGTGYAGANTHTKQVVLVWLPRVAAVLSLLGSLFIIFDTMRTCRKRAKLMNQLLSALSFFDALGSCAYAMTTLPTPKSDQLYGAKGNDLTCAVQGFFIQIGTIACFLNVSLAVYYLLTIKYGWNEGKLKRMRAAYFLFVPPIVIGLVYAFVGIIYSDNIRVWCNNSAKWWPEIPVIIAIIAATGIMGSLCCHVYRNEKRTTRYTYSAARLSIMVFKQSCWFVIAFYITWVPYIALQYMLSSGKGYVDYGLILIAATLVPLQGAWNNFIYIRTRYLNSVAVYVGSTVRRVSSLFRRSSNPKSTQQSALETMQQCAAHLELEVGHVHKNSSINVLDEEDNEANTENVEGVNCKTLTKTSKDCLGLKLCQGVGCINHFSDQCGNDASVAKESISGNFKFNQEEACSPDDNEHIDVGIVNEASKGNPNSSGSSGNSIGA